MCITIFAEGGDNLRYSKYKYFKLNMQTNNKPSYRIQSIDILRGIIIILMALDVRDYFAPTLFSATDLTLTTTELFLTRWITHLCAPVFIALTGVSAYLYQRRYNKTKLAYFLITRGILLIFLELTWVSFSWRFNLQPVFLLQVIWVLGCSMIFLSALIWLPRRLLLILAVIIILTHNLFDNLSFLQHPISEVFLMFPHRDLSTDSSLYIGNIRLAISYPLIPWFAVMAFTYAIGHWFQQPPAIRNKRIVCLGLACLSLFIIFRGFNFYGDPNPWETYANRHIFTLLSFININKYPPSLDYLLLTLGITFSIWPLFEKLHGRAAQFLLTFGQVPLFFYLIHIPIIHILAIIFSHAYYHSSGQWFFHNQMRSNNVPWPSTYEAKIWLVYTVWAIVIFITYFCCKAYRSYKQSHHYAWLRYL